MDSHYGKPNVIARAFREPRRAAGHPIAHTAKVPDNGRVCRPNPLVFEKSRLTPEEQDHIRNVAAMMQSTPTFVATIVGKTDSVGSADFNEHLSQRRAEAVFEALVYAT
jgi:flagellar motor protein MotB